MLIRTVSGAIYVVILVGFFLLKSVSPLFYNALIWFFSFMSAFEVARAVKNFSVKGCFVLATVFSALFVPVYTLSELLYSGYGFAFALGFTVLFCIIAAVLCVSKKTDVKTFGFTVLPILYPAILLLTTLAVNDMGGEKSLIGLLLIFVISPSSDVFAYLTGMTWNKIRKGKAKKLCPVLSPKKTVAGAIGGILGGAVGAVIIYFIFRETADAIITFMPAWILFCIIGVVGSVFTEAGDLFESGIKRKVGIKDMGNIMPGHGGVMDRIDGTVFCSAVVFAAFMFL